VINVAFIVGHTQRAQGADNYNGLSEYCFNRAIGYRTKDILDDTSYINSQVFLKDAGQDLLAAELRLFNPDVALELHFNSYKTKAYGCEAIIYRRSMFPEANKEAASIIIDGIHRTYNIKKERD